MTVLNLTTPRWPPRSLNPCYNGNGHDEGREYTGKFFSEGVLILVITEMVMTRLSRLYYQNMYVLILVITEI